MRTESDTPAENSEKQQKRKPRGKPFAKGKGADPRINRNGRPKGYAEFLESLRDLTPDALDVVREKLKQKNADVALKVLERAWGKAPAAPEDHEALKEALPKLTARQLVALAKLPDEEP